MITAASISRSCGLEPVNEIVIVFVPSCWLRSGCGLLHLHPQKICTYHVLANEFVSRDKNRAKEREMRRIPLSFARIDFTLNLVIHLAVPALSEFLVLNQRLSALDQ